MISDGRPMMKTLLAATALLLSLTLSGMYAQAAAPRGAVPTARAAILMARKIWISLYPDSAAKAGSAQAWLAGETAARDGDMWEVGPKMPGPDALGSGLVYCIDAKDGH